VLRFRVARYLRFVRWRRIVGKLLQLLNETWRQAEELIPVQDSETAQRGSAGACETDQHAPSIARVWLSVDRPTRLHAVNQANGTVVTNLEPIGQIRNTRRTKRSQTTGHQQQLVVLWLETN
jgi:hypothetical protein